MSLTTPANGNGNGNGNGKISLQNLGIISGFIGAFWILVQGENGHLRENQAKQEDEIRRTESRLVAQKQELDNSLQREMRLLNDALSKTADGNDRLSLDRHNFQEKEIADLRKSIDRLELKP